MEIFGKPTLNPLVFYSGKISGYIVWIALAYQIYIDRFGHEPSYLDMAAYLLFAIAMIFSLVSLLHLGRSTRFGLPTKGTLLKTRGIYRFSRNPMYVGFALFTIASMIYTLNPFVAILGAYSLVVYHMIIKNEEKFLLDQFGESYSTYKKNVRRYF